MLSLNFGCGSSYIIESNWINIDWEPHSKYVKRANLLSRFPFEDESFDLVYSSHFLEHLNHKQIGQVFNEVHRVAKSRAVIRLCVPDFELLSREYLRHLSEGRYEFAEFVKFEMLDQCVRTRPGGNIYKWDMLAPKNAEFASYMWEMIGRGRREGIPTDNYAATSMKSLEFKNRLTISFEVRKFLKYLHWQLICKSTFLFPKWFQEGHISLTRPGENHKWMFDFYQLKQALQHHGFTDVRKLDYRTTQAEDDSVLALDSNSAGSSRQGGFSMYVEATKV